MMEQKECHLIELQTVGEAAEGYISIAENDKNIPFEIKRVFCTYDTPVDVTRGGHAHRHTEMVLFALQGKIRLHTESASGEKHNWTLNRRDEGVYIPAYTWHTMEYSDDAIQMVLASTLYEETDYIQEYDAFKKIISGASKPSES